LSFAPTKVHLLKCLLFDGESNGLFKQEFYQLLDKNGIAEDIHLLNDMLREWEDYYNYHRPHGALDGQIPYGRFVPRRASASVSPKS